MNDTTYMRRALQLARRGTGRVSPNPRVGAVLVKQDTIISEAYHARFGGPHAEITAIRRLDLKESRGSTLYVNLEPCVHFGKTSPCTQAIIQAGIRRVVIGVLDPNPLVNGQGVLELKKAGIQVEMGVLEGDCTNLNEAFFKYIKKKKPFITLKLAQTLDGKIATQNGQSRWITGETARRRVHQFRREHDAILLGVNTVIEDDPALTVRMVRGRNPKRIVLDSRLRMPFDAHVLQTTDPENTIIVTTKMASKIRIEKLRERNHVVWILENDHSDRIALPALWKKIAGEGICSVFIEGGGEVATSVIKSGEVDRIILFFAPKLFGSGITGINDLNVSSPEKAITFRQSQWRKVGNDMMFEGRF
jgi:diaminohydroxyphosphoribosylaminopyrimidine deaminase/5-amino-6-(5-phosphoribosylamino)uracil reductase